MSWVPLHQHSQYSILDATASVKAIAKKAFDFGMPAVALTDHGNMYGAVEFYQACTSVGIKPIVGCEVYVAPGSRFEKKRVPGQKTANHLVLLAKNEVGYRNLCKLTSIGFTEGFYYHPRIDREVLSQHAEGLICLSGCMGSRVSQAILNDEDFLGEIRWHQELFGDDYYLELQRHRQESVDELMEESWLVQQYESFIEKQEKINTALREVGIKVVATNDSHYMERDDWKAHEILLNVQSGEPCEIWERDSLGNPKQRVPNPKRRTYPTHECYFKSPEQMVELFADCPEAITNTLEIAEKCNLTLDFETKHYPAFKCEGTPEAFLADLCEKSIPLRYTEERLKKVSEHCSNQDPMRIIRERLAMEMEIISSKEMCDYLLIVWDFIDWAKRHGIPVGPGRGSGAGSIILYLIGVTDIEPLRFDLLFERFINPERASYPDIDVDICMERRGEVIDYVVEKYGQDCVAQIITFGTMKAKMAIKDVGRVLSVPLSKVNAIAKLIPEEIGMTIERALDIDADLYRMYTQDDETHRLIDLAKRLEGAIRNTGVHAAGVIVSGEPLTGHIPICTAKDSEMSLTQYAMKPVEKVGMLKMDFLGLKTLTSIQMALAAVDRDIDVLDLPLDDAKTFALLNQGKTMGIFQMESAGMQDLARNLHLDHFEEMIAVVALYRPGPMDMIPSFVERKHGREKIEYDHPLMEEILKETYGIMVYQEQVMQIAQKLGGYTLAEGDVLRLAMGKKIHEEMVKQREKFTQGAIANGVDEATAIVIFDKIEKFASYGFNKSHAACYGFIAYITAYFKANYPKEWMAALMTCDGHDTAKVAKFIRECQAMGINVLPPDINESTGTFTATAEGIRFAISAIRGVGHGVVDAIVKERKTNGPFKNLYDFCRRVDAKQVGKKVVEQLVWAGAFDFTGWTRDQLALSAEPTYETTSTEQKEEATGVISLFSLIEGGTEKQFEKPPVVKHSSTSLDLLFRERELLGVFVTGHPMDEYRDKLQKLSVISLNGAPRGTPFRSACIIDAVKIRISRAQKKFAILTISDGEESVEVPVWPDLFESTQHLLIENQLLYTVLRIDEERISCRWLGDLTKVDEAMIADCDRAYDADKHRPRFERKRKEEVSVKSLTIKLDADTVRLSEVLKLKELFRASKGASPITLEFHSENRSIGKVSIAAAWGVTLSPTLKNELSSLKSVKEVV